MKRTVEHGCPSPAWAALACAALVIGCTAAADPACGEAVPEAAANARADAPLAPATAEPAARISAGSFAPSVTVTVAGSPDDHILAVEAVHGSFDEPLVLVATAASAPPAAFDGEPAIAPPAPARERVPIAISSAYSGGDDPVPLRLLDAATGREVDALDMAPGQHAYLRVAGDGFTREAMYRANLTIFGAEPSVYRLRIQSAKPHRPLGLRATKWASTFANVPVFQRQGLRLVLPVDGASRVAAPYHVAVKPPSEMVENAEALPACGIVARPAGQAGLIVVELPPLETGRYAGVIEIQGEPLSVDITLKNPFWWVWLLVAAGAGLSLGVREYLRYRTAREEAERKIAAKERELAKKTDGLGLLAWDELRVRNVLRLARGRKWYLALDDVAGVLEDATPQERPERVTIDRALNETALPSPLRAALRERFERVGQIACRDDAREIDRAIAELAREAERGFVAALARWLKALGERQAAVEERVLRRLGGADPPLDPDAARQVKTALHVLGMLVEDARSLGMVLSADQAEVLSKIEPALAQIERWVDAGEVPAAVIALIHGDLRKVEAPDPGEPAEPPEGLRLRARGDGVVLNANEEITFEIVGPDGPLDRAPLVQPPCLPIEWWVDRQREVRGGARVTFVFQSAGWLGLRRRRVEARVNGRTIALWNERISRPELSPAVYERTWSLGARAAATLVGVIVTGAAAIGLLWTNRAFGGWNDYIAAALTGLGVDVAFVAGGGRLLSTVLSSVLGRRQEENL